MGFGGGPGRSGSAAPWKVARLEPFKETLACIKISEKGGLSLRGVAFREGFGGFHGFGGSGKHLALLLLVLQVQDKEATVTVLTVLAASAVSVTATPLKLKPLFRHPHVNATVISFTRNT